MSDFSEGGPSRKERIARALEATERKIQECEELLRGFTQDVEDIRSGIEVQKERLDEQDRLAEKLLGDNLIDHETAMIIGKSMNFAYGKIEDQAEALAQYEDIRRRLEAVIAGLKERRTKLLQELPRNEKGH